MGDKFESIDQGLFVAVGLSNYLLSWMWDDMFSTSHEERDSLQDGVESHLSFL